MKSKHFGKKLITAMLALIMVVSVVSGCSSNKTPGGSTDSTAPAEKVYTYNEYIQKFPNSWSTHNATSDADSYVQGYTEMGLYAYTLSEDKSTYAFIDEMAKGDPVNVTAVYKDQYGIKETDITDNLNVGKAWEITLNPDATWENGEKITADDYVWSMERVIAPEMKNSLSSTFITGEMALYNANNYYISGYQESYHKVMEKKVYTDEELLALVDNGVLYFSFDTHVTDDPTSMALSKNHSIEKMKAHYQNTETGEDVYDILYNKYASAANEYGYIKITRDNYEDFKTQLSVLSASALKAFFPNWYVLLSLKEVVSPAYTKILAATTYTDEEIDNLINEGKLFFSFQSALMDSEGSHTVESYHNLKAGKKFFTDADGVDHYVSLYEKYASVANEFGYIQITQRNKADFIEHFKDAWHRFRKNKASIVALCIISLLIVFSIVVPFVSSFDMAFSDPIYRNRIPKNSTLAKVGIATGTYEKSLNARAFDYYSAIGIGAAYDKENDVEDNSKGIGGKYSAIRATGNTDAENQISVTMDAYLEVGFKYLSIRQSEYDDIVAYERETGRTVLYPMVDIDDPENVDPSDANYWFLTDFKGNAIRDANGNLQDRYLRDKNGDVLYCKNRDISGLYVRVLYYEYFEYKNGTAPEFLFGSNPVGQDILIRLASGVRLSLLLAFGVSIINLIIGAIYGTIEGYYGGAVDLTMERIVDILSGLPFIVVATLFQMHFANKAGILPSLLFAFVLTGWIGTSRRVRTQFYRFKNQEYVLAARTLGASDFRLMLVHMHKR